MAKVLIIEDDQLMSRLYEKAFRFEKYDVELAANGDAGLDKAKSGKPTLILLDIMMPGKNGFEVLEELKARTNTKNIPVVVLTNLAGTGDAEKALKMGAVKYIIKSQHEPTQIVAMVKEILAGYTRQDVPQSAAPVKK